MHLKKRGGFRQIVVDGRSYQYVVSTDKLIFYDDQDRKNETPLVPLSSLGITDSTTWRGKHGDKEMGKREVAALIRSLSQLAGSH